MIEIQNLTFSYGNEEPVLKNISLTIEKGDYLAIVGQNGTGKSTLIKCLLGVNKVKNSMITIEGEDINKYQNLKIGYVCQEKANIFDIPITVKEYLALITTDHKLLERVIEQLDLSEIINQKIISLSGGQNQRVMIAKALITNIDYLILDEPITGLDQAKRQKFHDLLVNLNKQGITIIIVSHHLDEIYEHVQKIYDLEKKELNVFDRTNCKYC